MSTNVQDVFLRLAQERGLVDPGQSGGDVLSTFTQLAAQQGAQPRPTWERDALREQSSRGQRAVEMARQFSGRVIDSGLLSPTQALAELPGLIGLDGSPLDIFADRLRSYRDGVMEERERRAFEVGLTEREVAWIGVAGDVVGFTLPAVGALKAASLLRGSRNIMPFDVLQDVTGGAIFGGLLTPGENVQERAKAAVLEGGLFGATGLVMKGIFLPLMRYRNARIAGRADDLDLQRKIKELGGDNPHFIATREEARGIARQLNEEEWIIRSPGAQRILERNADETAVAQAIMDMAEASGNVGVVRGIKDPTDIITRFETEFPVFKGKMSFFRADNPARPEHLRGKPGTFDLYFGTTGLSNKAKTQLARQGFFEGQKIIYTKGGIEGTFLGKTAKGRVIFLDPAGKIKRVAEKNIRDLPYGTVDADLRTPARDALYQDFSRFYEQTAQKLRAGADELNPDDLVRAVASGRVDVDDLTSLRFINEPNAIVYPQEAGITPEALVETFAAVNARRVEAGLPPIKTNSELLTLAGTQFVRPNPTVMLGTFDDIFQAWGRERGLILSDIVNINEAAAGASRMTPHRQFSRVPAWDPSTTPSATPTGEGSLPVPVEKVRNLIRDPADLEVTRTHFAERLRQDLLRQVPKEDMDIFTRILGEMVEIGERIPDSVGAKGARAGFHVSKRTDGTVVARDINSGLKFPFRSENEAGEFLDQVIRGARESTDGLVIPENMFSAVTTNPGLLRQIDGELIDPNLGLAQQARDGVSFRAFTNFRDWIINVDRDLGTPFFTRYVDRLIKGHAQVVQESVPWIRQVDRIFKGWKQDDMNLLGTYMTQLETNALNLNRLLTPNEKIQVAKELGLRNAAKYAAKSDEFTKIMRAGARTYGFPEDRIIPEYFGRIRPFAEKHDGIIDPTVVFPEGIPAHWQWAQDMMRTGEMARFELNPALMAMKWFQGAAKNRHLKEPWEELAKVVGTRQYGGMKIGELSPAHIEAMVKRVPELQAMSPEALMAQPVVPEPIADVLREFLTMTRGMPSKSLDATRRTFKDFFGKLGVNMDERALDEYVNVGLSTMYGAAMGLRIMQTARNLTQPTYLTGGRLGFRDSNEAMKRALTIEGYKEAAQEGVIRSAQGGAGIPLGDQIFERMAVRIEGTGLLSNALASAARGALRVGNLSRKTAEKFLIPYTATDELNRAWTYHWYKQHTQRLLSRFEAGQITQARFMDDLAPGMAANLKNEALKVRQREGNERFLRTVARWGTDEDAFIYGASVQPPWMQHPVGRFMGMFGTWPIWLKSHYGRVIKNMTPAQQAAFIARNVATTGAIVTTGYSMGVNMWNWIAPISVVNYSGGPGVEYLIDAQRLISAPMDQKADAAQKLVSNAGGLAFPGQVFYREMVRTTDVAENFPHGVLLMGLGRPLDEDHWFFDHILNQRPMDRIKDSPSVKRWMDNEDGFFESGPATPRFVPSAPVTEERPGLPLRPLTPPASP